MATKRYRERRIMGGVLHNVMTENGKIVEDLGPVKKEQPSEPQIVNNAPEEQKYTTGLQLVTDDDTPQEKKSGIKLTPVPKIKGKQPTWEDILSKIPEPDPDRVSPTTETQNKVEQTKLLEPVPSVPSFEPVLSVPSLESVLQVPKIESAPVEPSDVPIIPKLKINIPKEKKDVSNMPIPGVPSKTISNMPIPGVPSKTISTSVTSDTYRKSNNVVGTNLQKADEGISQQQEPNIEKPKEKRRHMEEELEAELLTERKFEEWVKKQKFRENLEKAAKFAEETKVQFEEKIPELSTKIEGITDEVKGVETRLGTVDKSVGDLCSGVDCIKTDVKNYQENVKKYQESQEELEKMVQDRFRELGDKVQSLEHPLFTCENCGEQAISPLSSYCPNCGSPIHSWSDETGEPIRGWTPYWKRIGREVPQ